MLLHSSTVVLVRTAPWQTGGHLWQDSAGRFLIRCLTPPAAAAGATAAAALPAAAELLLLL